MTKLENRKKVCCDIKEAIKSGARIKEACKIIELGYKTFLRWEQASHGDLRVTAVKSHPKALSQKEKDLVIDTCNLFEFKDMSPNEIVPILAERGTYIASESTFFKLLKEQKLLKHRENTKVPKKKQETPRLEATGPNQVWSWDITYLRTSVKGIYFYLYLFMDIWSREIVGWTINERESGDIASETIKEICLKNDISSINLHSDNGSPMKCGTMLATLQWLGVTPSFSRPSVSNDNPFSEALFKTLKYRASYPANFETIEQANNWVETFVAWYNTEHHHAGIKFVTPEQRHLGKDIEILKKRKKTYEVAKSKNPLRWVKETRNWERQKTVSINKKSNKIHIKKIS